VSDSGSVRRDDDDDDDGAVAATHVEVFIGRICACAESFDFGPIAGNGALWVCAERAVVVGAIGDDVVLRTPARRSVRCER
jgi:hypothetical protein